MSRTRRLAPNRVELGQIAIALVVATVFGVMYQSAPALLALIVPTGMAAVILLVGLRLLIPESIDEESAQWLRRLTGAMFVVHLLIALAISSSSQLVTTFGGDAVTYHLGAIEIVNHWNNGTTLTTAYLQTGKEGFFYGLAGLYWLFGNYQTAGLAVNAAFAAAIVPLLYDTTRRLFGKEAARVAAIMVVILPGFVVWTSQLLREASIVFFLALAANAVVRLTERAALGAYAALASSVAILFTLRANVSLVAGGGFLVALVVGRKRFLEGATTAATSLVLVLALVLGVGIGYSGYTLTSNSDLETINGIRVAQAKSVDSGFAPDTDVTTGRKAVRFLPVAALNFGLGPFPWQVRNARQLGGALDALALWILLPSLWRGWRAANRTIGRRWITLVAPALFITVALSLLIGNYGGVVRERLQVSIFLIPFAAYGWTLRKRRTTADAPTPSMALSRRS